MPRSVTWTASTCARSARCRYAGSRPRCTCSRWSCEGCVGLIARLAPLPGVGLAAPMLAHAGSPDAAFCGSEAAAVERRVDDLLAQMTLAEKIDQMHDSGFSDGAWRTPDNPRLGIPGFAMIDGPRGVQLLAGDATSFPVA